MKTQRQKQVICLSEYLPKDENVIIDTNILIRIFTPYNVGYLSTEKIYDTIWSKLKKSECRMIISAIQISEFINRCIRIEFSLYQKSINDFSVDYKKDYRSTEDYKEKMDDILSIVKDDIIPNFTFVDDGFSGMKNSDIFGLGFSYDFNDALLVEIARKYDATMVTDDSDYGNYKLDFPIVTSNNFLLAMRH